MPKAKESDKQFDKFKQAAREVETDDDEKRFDERLKRVAKPQKPSDKRDDSKHE